MIEIDIFDEMLYTDDEFIESMESSYESLINEYRESIDNYSNYKNTLNPMYIGNIKNNRDEFFLFEDGSENVEAKSTEEQGLENIGKSVQAAAVNTGGGIIKFITWITERIHGLISWIFKTSIGLLNLTSAQVARWTGRITLNLDMSDLYLYLNQILPAMEKFYNMAKECLNINNFRIRNNASKFNGAAFQQSVNALDPLSNKFYNLKINGTTVDFREGYEKFFYLFPYIRKIKEIRNGIVDFEKNNKLEYEYKLPQSITDEEQKNIVALADEFITKSKNNSNGRSLENSLSYMELLQYTLQEVRDKLNKIFTDPANGLKALLNNAEMDSDFRAWISDSNTGGKPTFDKLKQKILDAMSKLTGFISVEMKDAQTIVSTMKTILQENNRAVENREREKVENNEKTDNNDPNDPNVLKEPASK